MNYAEILAQVTALTGHDDLAAEKESMIQAATLRMHQLDYFQRDVMENVVDLGSEDYTFSFAQSTFTRFRALQYLRKTDALVDGVASTIYTPLDPLQVLDAYGVEKNDVWYVGGNNVVLRSSTPVQFLLAGWYANPVISPVGSYASWIADTVPFAIIFDACSLIFQMLAQQDQARKFDALVLEAKADVLKHGLTGRGY